MEKECECYEEEFQPYRTSDYKPIIYIYIYIVKTKIAGSASLIQFCNYTHLCELRLLK